MAYNPLFIIPGIFPRKFAMATYFKTNSVLSWPSNRRRCKQWSEGRTSSNDFYFTQRTSIGLQISNQQGAIKMIKRIKWHHVEHHLLRWSRKGAINTYISSAHVRDGAWGPIGPGGLWGNHEGGRMETIPSFTGTWEGLKIRGCQ